MSSASVCLFKVVLPALEGSSESHELEINWKAGIIECTYLFAMAKMESVSFFRRERKIGWGNTGLLDHRIPL